MSPGIVFSCVVTVQFGVVGGSGLERVERCDDVLGGDAGRRDHLATRTERCVHERHRPGVLEDDERSGGTRLECIGCLSEVVIAEKARACADEGGERATELVEGDAREGAVGFLADGDEVVQGDDTQVDERRLRRGDLVEGVPAPELEQDVVDGTVGFGHAACLLGRRLSVCPVAADVVTRLG
jgi:hypothetical protein